MNRKKLIRRLDLNKAISEKWNPPYRVVGGADPIPARTREEARSKRRAYGFGYPVWIEQRQEDGTYRRVR